MATITGVAIWPAASRIATVSGFPIARLRWMFSIVTVASSTSRPIASDSPPSVMMLNELPVRLSPITAVAIASGIEMQAMTTLRQLPRNAKIMSPTRTADDHAFAQHAADGGPDERRLIEVHPHVEAVRRHLADLGDHRSRGLDDRQRRRVGLLENRQVRRAPAVDPHDVRLLGKPVAHPRHIADRHLGAVDDLDRDVARSPSTLAGLEFIATSYSRLPMRAVPAGRMMFDSCKRREDVLGGQSLAVQRMGVDIDRDLAHLAAIGLRRRQPGDGEQPKRTKFCP